MKRMHRVLTPLAAACVLALSACGGGGSSSSSSSGSSATTAFPSGLAVGVPTDVSTSVSSSMAVPADGLRVALDWGRSMWHALSEGDGRQMAKLAAAALPIGQAHATGAGPELAEKSALLDKVVSGDASVSLASVLKLSELFAGGATNASCYGPNMPYATHQDGAPAAGTLPGGDLGLWKVTEADGTPCVAAQLSARVSSVKKQTMQGLLMAAVMRKTIATSSTLTMPAAGSATDLTSDLAAAVAGAFTGLGFTVTVETATVSLDAGGTVYTYRLVLSNGLTGLNYKRGEVILRHTPGGSASTYSGVLQVSAFTESNDGAFGCGDVMDGANYKVARVNTVKYSRAGSDIHFSNRSAAYCGHPTNNAGSDYGSQVASFTGDGQLDPAVALSGSTRGATLGWRGDFNRFAGDFDKTTIEGNFLYVWQAGTGDDHSRALAANSSVNSSTGDRSVKGFFGYAAPIASTTGAIQGMICNWAGPGNNHTPLPKFQYQSATLLSGASLFTLGMSRITYAPTVSCDSSTTQYDADANGTLTAGEGVGTANNLDTLHGLASVDDVLTTVYSYSKPSLF